MNAEKTANAAFLLTSVEVGLGSLIHAFHLPLGGHFLSLNQGLLLLWSTESLSSQQAFESANQISTVAALLKSLSPAGKKLTPMLAISMQGFLYSLGVLVFGNGRVGRVFGMIALSAWGVLQPVLLTAFLFGMGFFESIEKSTGNLLPWLLGALALKAAIAVGVAFLGFSVSLEAKEKYLKWILSQHKRGTEKSKTKSKAKFSFRMPLLIGVSILINLGFFAMSGKFDAEGVWTYLLRPLAVFVLLVFVSRHIPGPVQRAVIKRFPKMAQALELAKARSFDSKSLNSRS